MSDIRSLIRSYGLQVWTTLQYNVPPEAVKGQRNNKGFKVSARLFEKPFLGPASPALVTQPRRFAPRLSIEEGVLTSFALLLSFASLMEGREGR